MNAYYRDLERIKPDFLAKIGLMINEAKSKNLQKVSLKFENALTAQYAPLVFDDLEALGYAFSIDDHYLQIWNFYPFNESDYLPLEKDPFFLTDDQNEQIVQGFKRGESMISLGKRFNRSREQIRKIIRKKI